MKVTLYHIAGKTITYRFVASGYTFVIAYVITQNISLAAGWSFLDAIGKLFLYGTFEWLWTFFVSNKNSGQFDSDRSIIHQKI